MKTIRLIILALCGAITLTTQNLFAHENPICTDILNNSCWSIENKSGAEFTMRCQNETGMYFSVDKLKPQEKWSYQYCSGLSDGMGFAAGKVKCSIARAKDAPATFAFSANEFGERVQFEVLNKKLHVRTVPSGTTRVQPIAEIKF